MSRPLENQIQPTQRMARLTGALYLLFVVTSLFSFFLPTLIVTGDATATAHNILASETLFRMGVVIGLIPSILFIFLAWALYRLLNGVNKTYAGLMVTFVAISATISFLSVVPSLVALQLLQGASFLSVFQPSQLDAVALVLLDNQGFVLVNTVFFGLWLFPFGVLVYRSGFIPRIFGIFLFVSVFAFLGDSLVLLVFPSYGNVANIVTYALDILGELSTMAWLLVKGVKAQPLKALAP